jgi:hypothetical protein
MQLLIMQIFPTYCYLIPLWCKCSSLRPCSQVYTLSPLTRKVVLTMFVPTFADRGCHVVSVTDPYGRVLGFLDLVETEKVITVIIYYQYNCVLLLLLLLLIVEL